MAGEEGPDAQADDVKVPGELTGVEMEEAGDKAPEAAPGVPLWRPGPMYCMADLGVWKSGGVLVGR